MDKFTRNVVVSILFTILGGPGIVLVYIPYWITRFHIPPEVPFWLIVFAIALIALGACPLFESIHRFIFVGRGTFAPVVPTDRLVMSGFYEYVRNPMYVGSLLIQAGEVILFHRRNLLIYTAIVAVVFYLFVRLYEEPNLARRFPADFQRFKGNVPPWLPRPYPWRSDQS